MTITRRNRDNLIDIREERIYHCSDMNLRDADDTDELVLTGYASTFQPYEMYGGPENYGWIEHISRNAFDRTLRENPDLHLLINHGGMPLARTKSGTLKLSVDDGGLRVEARLDRTDPDVQRLEPKMRRGDMDEMSFAFRVKSQEWSAAQGFEHLDDDQTYREITELSLHKGDVSVVNFGANPTTSAELKSIDALKMLANCDEAELAEIRKDDAFTPTMEKLSAGIASPVVSIQNLNIVAPEVDLEERNEVPDEPAADEARDTAFTDFVEAQIPTESVFTELNRRIETLEEALRTLTLQDEPAEEHRDFAVKLHFEDSETPFLTLSLGEDNRNEDGSYTMRWREGNLPSIKNTINSLGTEVHAEEVPVEEKGLSLRFAQALLEND